MLAVLVLAALAATGTASALGSPAPVDGSAQHTSRARGMAPPQAVASAAGSASGRLASLAAATATAGTGQPVSANGPTGLDLTAAFQQYTTGDPHVVVAYIEGGINWHLPVAASLVDHIYVNWRELPVPCVGVTVATAVMTVGGATEPCHTVYSTDEADYDILHTGTVDAADWANDPRVPRANGTSYVNPEDLVATFCGAGYRPPVDPATGLRCDVSGWNFFRNGPDAATADAAYPHSDGQMQNLLAQCPQCTIMPVKAGQESLDPTQDLAQAWLFACESGASVIDSVTADLGYSTFMRQVISYCERKGVVMVESSNDFDSTDHQGGMYWPHVVPGNGVVADPAGTAWVRSNMTSWGTHNVVSVPGQSSTSGSTSALGGLFGLLLSWGRKAYASGLIRQPLTGPQAVQLMRAASVPVTGTSLLWPGAPGSWSVQYGYGVPNLDRAMQMVAAGQVPPATEITSPDWYRIEDPTRSRSVRVAGRILPAPGSGPVHWVTQASLGAQTSSSSWFTIGSGETTGSYSGTLGTLDLADVPRSFWGAPFALSSTAQLTSTEQYTVTVRVVATDAAGLTGVSRRAVDVVHDPSWPSCFPLAIGSSGESQPAIVDLQGTGQQDIVFGTADGTVDAINPRTCRELPGFPAYTAPVRTALHHPAGVHVGHQPIIADVAVGDLAHTGHLDVVATTLSGEVYAFDAHGRLLPGWPKSAVRAAVALPVPRPADPYTRLPAPEVVAAPVLVHLSGPLGTLDVVQASMDGDIHAWDARGRDVPGWPVTVQMPAGTSPPPGYQLLQDHELAATPTVAYLFGRSAGPDIVERSQFTETRGSGIQLLGYGFTFAFDAQGKLLTGWPVRLPGLVEYYGSAQQFITEGADQPVAADVQGHGVDEVEVSSVFGVPFLVDGAGQVTGAYASVAPGQPPSAVVGQEFATILAGLNAAPGSPVADVPITFTTSGAFGRMGGTLRFGQAETGGLSILKAEEQPNSGTGISEHEVVYPAAGGPPSPGFPAPRQGIDFLGAPLFADVGPGPGVDLVDGGDSNAIVAYTATGAVVPGFPKWTPGWNLFSPTTGDLFGTGHVDLVSTTREGYLMAWATPGPASANVQWPRWHHDLHNSGNDGVHAQPPGVPRAVRWRVGQRELTFVAPGGRGTDGTVGFYMAAFSLGSGRVDHRWLAPQGHAGTVQSVSVPPGTTAVTVQAVNDAGVLGHPVTVSGAG